jgi:alpha-1,2-mannosyltransferase
MRIVFTAVLLALSAVATALSVSALPYYDYEAGQLEPLVFVTAGLWALFVLSLVTLRGVAGRASVVLVLVGSLAIGVAAMAGPPNTSTDSARYAWDGIVQNAGISPYTYVPSDPALEDLRTDWLFPAPVDGECVGERIMTVDEPGTGDLVCTAINRAKVPTIYPPASELVFAGVRAITGDVPEYWPSQLFGLLVSLAVTVLLLRALQKSGRDPRWAAIWGWSPLVATEGVTNSHIDILSALLLVVASLLVASGRRWAGGAALGASIATKLIPVIGAPALLGRRPLPVIVASVGVFLLLYIPYVIADGIEVLGYLPGYLSEEGYESGTRFIMLSLVAPGPASLVLAAVLIAVTGALVWWKTDPADPWLGQLVMIGVTLLVVTPRYPWYALLLVPMIAMTGRWEWLAVPLALTERLLIPSVDLARLSVVVAVVVIAVMSVRRAGWVIVSPRDSAKPALNK